MDAIFKNDSLDRLETDPDFNGGFGDSVVRAYRRALHHIRAASDERTFYARKSFHFEKLSGDRQGQYSMRLNDQWRLILELQGQAPNKIVHLIEIIDYH